MCLPESAWRAWAGSIAANVVYIEKVNEALAQVASDQAELTIDQQEVNVLNGITSALTTLQTSNETVQSTLEGIVDPLTARIGDAQTTIIAIK